MRFELSIQHRFDDFSIDARLSGSAGVTAVFGPSGAGKTTLINAMAGLFHPHAGSASLGSRVLWNERVFLPPHKRRIGYVFQNPRLFPHLSVARNIDYGTRYAAEPPSATDRGDIIALLGIDHLLRRQPAALSGGEAQRVALARALLSAPDMLLMDEPLAALDGARKDEILPFLEKLKRARPLPILYITHSMDEIARLADQLVMMENGRITADGAMKDLLADPALLPRLGLRNAGAVLDAKVVSHSADGLTRLDTPAGPVDLPGVRANPGETVRVHIPATDIILSRTHPKDLSARNILPVTIAAIHKGKGPGAAIALQAGETRLIARITARAISDMNLAPGQNCFAILKASAIARSAIGT